LFMTVDPIDTTRFSDDERLLIEVVSTPSVSGTERTTSALFVRHALARGFEAQVDEAHNAVAHTGARAEDALVHVVLLGHIDTVPGDIPVRVEGGVLHGRGSVDAKGPLCAMLCAATRASLPEGVRLTVAGAAGEESAGSPGARHLVNRFQPDACVIGEPSGWDGVTLGYKGRLIATATARCPEAHTAGPEASACDRLALWWANVHAMLDTFNAGETHPFGIVQSTIRELHSTNDGLEQVATMRIGFRLPMGMTPDELGARLTALMPAGVWIELDGPELPHCTDRNDPVVRAISSAIRGEGGRPHPKKKTGTADFNVVGPVWGCPIAAYGPGDSSLDHTPGEHLHLDEYERSIRVLTRAIESLSAELLAGRAAELAGAPGR